MYWLIRDLWGPANLVASTVAELDNTLLYFTDDIGIVFGPTTDYPRGFRVEDGTRIRWARLDFLIVITKGDHSCCLRGSCVSYCLVTLQGLILIRISATHSDMGDACSLLSFCRSAISPCSRETYG
jgi:hypothetical protein